MNTGALGAALVTLFISTQGLAAQQPEQRAPQDSAARGMTMGQGMQQQMRVMDSMNARLDTLVRRMNRATGNVKITAMAQVINELVAQRRAMQTHMHQMMQSHGKMMGGQMMMETDAESTRAPTSKPKPGRETPGTDTSSHAEHHPEK
jgi:hypothetical protein